MRVVEGKDRHTYAQAELDWFNVAGLLMQCSSSSIDAAAKLLYKARRSTDTGTQRQRSERMKYKKRGKEGGKKGGKERWKKEGGKEGRREGK